jgi:serine/threonine-protein kinase
MRPDEERKMEGFLLPIANSISDGSEVDWSEAESSTDSEQQEMVRQLKALADIAAVHRGLQSSAGPGVSLETTGPGLRSAIEAGPQRWGHLEIIDKVGTGSFGEVYRARDTRLDSEVALKLLRRDASKQSDRATQVIEEARLMARVKHDNVVRVHGAERHEGRVGIWMEFIHGRNLEEILEESGTRGANEAIDIGCDLCPALAEVHRKGVIHRDIKTKNVMREEGGRLVLMDFGSGSSVELEEGGTAIGVAGTPLYMAPELFRGGQATARSDIYSLGVLLYHLVTASYPVKATDLAGLRQAHERGDRELLGDVRPDLPVPFRRVVEKALEPDPSKRYQSPGQFEKALEEARGTQQHEDEDPVPWWRKLLRWYRAQRRPIQALVPAAVAIAIFALFSPDITNRFRPPIYDIRIIIYRDGHPAQVLLPGETISVGDELFIQFEGSRELYVYVLNHDETGESYLLFPISDSKLKNPLPPGNHQLPGPGDESEIRWTVTSEGGREHIVIITSPEQLVELEAEMLSLSQPQAVPATELGPYTQMSEKTTALLTRGITRGIGGVVERPSGGAQERDEVLESIFDTIDKLGTGAERARGVWVRQIELVHQAPNP